VDGVDAGGVDGVDGVEEGAGGVAEGVSVLGCSAVDGVSSPPLKNTMPATTTTAATAPITM
jgi:hypothetical protein